MPPTKTSSVYIAGMKVLRSKKQGRNAGEILKVHYLLITDCLCAHVCVCVCVCVTPDSANPQEQSEDLLL